LLKLAARFAKVGQTPLEPTPMGLGVHRPRPVLIAPKKVKTPKPFREVFFKELREMPAGSFGGLENTTGF
jgi:hypothetical protein